ncbi:MAG TPA: PEP-CTERM sorting domain-containing protein, partial [Fimbriimonadaceae bacterium]|nr:PEP-CTERM sorting domain-containing protein [Fimbriimonadaceae bacterium]
WIAICVVLGLAAGAGASFYQYDDGTSEGALTSGQIQPDFLVGQYLNQYTIASGGETLTSIDLVWGSHLDYEGAAPIIPNGLAVQVLLLSDPNQDGDPSDAQVIQSIDTVTANVGSDTFNSYALNPVTMAVGTSFFVGAYIPSFPDGYQWAPLDFDATGKSANGWFAVAPAGLLGGYSSLSMFGTAMTFMVRADASPVPEPVTLAVLGVGVLALLRRRR